MRLVPKQLKRSGMTGSVPYYGGRFTPAQAHAAAHQAGQSKLVMTPGLMPMPAVDPTPTIASTGPAAASAADNMAALQRLADAGLLTPAEVASVRARIRP